MAVYIQSGHKKLASISQKWQHIFNQASKNPNSAHIYTLLGYKLASISPKNGSIYSIRLQKNFFNFTKMAAYIQSGFEKP